MNGKNCHHSPRATLAAVGLKLQALQLLAPIREKVKIAQKKIKHELDRGEICESFAVSDNVRERFDIKGR